LLKSQDKETERLKKQKTSVFDDSSLGSTDSSNNISNQIVKVQPQGKLRGKELLFHDKKQEQGKNQERLLPTAKNRASKFTSRVNAQFLYYDVFTIFTRHVLPEDLDLLREIVKNIMTTLPSQHMSTMTPQYKLNSEVASWNMSYKATTSVSSSVFEDNVGEDGLLSRLTYKENIKNPYHVGPNGVVFHVM
jgi:hypothetical protein